MVKKKRSPSKQSWKNEIDDLIRGASGGFLFGIPLMYTMEVWWIGSYTEPPIVLGAIAANFIVVFLLNRTAGFRKTKDIDPINALIDSIQAMAIGIVCAGGMLFLLRQITASTPLSEALGKLIFESVAFTFGVALSNQFLSGGGDEDRNQTQKEDRLNATITDIGGTLIGAIIIAFSIAPTDEIPMLASSVSGLWLLAIIAASLLISYCIVFAANFGNQNKREQQRGIFQRPLSETIMSYLVSLMAAAFMLWFFHQLTFDDPWQIWLNYTLLLGLPATVGGAAGRLAV